MKVLHTADWHLGQKFHDKERYEEHQAFLDWLLTTIREQSVDLLLISGDIFDIGNPPNRAIEQYYNFLAKFLQETPCQHAIITGGNHDSIYSLNAPKDLLKFMKLHIIGGATDNLEDEIVEIKDKNGNIEAVVCAVPFLRDKDINYNKASLSQAEREKHILDSITLHYQELAKIVEERGYPSLQVPIIAMGHLFAQGGRHSEEEETSEGEKNIYIGNLGKIPAEAFPETFHYVALGHLHRSQKVGGKDHIRYSGSPIPLSFSERKDEKSVLLIEFEQSEIKFIKKILVPQTVHKRLIRFEGTLEQVCKAIQNFETEQETWVEVLVRLEKYNPHAKAIIEEAASKNPKIQIIRSIALSVHSSRDDWAKVYEHQNLSELSVEEVFLERCKKENYVAKEIDDDLLPLFRQLIQTFEENG
ncbi:MAG: exonuclease SbcCD subunit D C-terminal domain-containing protein [Raineya sp.]|jgi:exonuclease SbcD|nr:exonuclease SbcCD subunit D C-terminal domain-containing protein [Raineya sp.]